MKKRIGEYLLEQKLITENQLEEALLEQKNAFNHKFIGEIFIEKEILSKEDFGKALEDFMICDEVNKDKTKMLLGNILVKCKAITQKQLDAALKVQMESKEKKYIGEILIDEEYLTVHQLEVYLKNQKTIKEKCK
ncbi:MAG: hypothetical protein KAS64_05170 [Spirochaetes bacterium]|nr:hypothetical protein [Spirochaetota bacterium]